MMNMVSILAINEDKYIEIYKQYAEYFSNFSVFGDVMRTLGWWILKAVCKLVGLLNSLLDIVFSFINFLDSPEVEGLFMKVKPLIWTVLLFALLYLAYCYIYAHEKPKGVVTNVLLFVGTIMILPYMMVQMNQIVTYGKELLSDNNTAQESNYDLLLPYITDLVYLDNINFNADKIANGMINGYQDSTSIEYLDINEVVDPADYSLKNIGLYEKQIVSEIKNGKESLSVAKIKKSKFFFKDTTPYYYRFHVNFFIALFYLLAIGVVLCFSSFKVISLIMELVSEKILTPFIAAGDLTGGQKIRKALVGILNAYITILCVFFLQRVFVLACSYINGKTWSDNAAANGVAKVFMIIAAALFVVDGPNFFEQIFGVDAGLKSVGQALQSAFYASQMMSGTNSMLKGMMRKPLDAMKGGVGMAATAAGAFSGMRDTGVMGTNNQKVSEDMAKTGTGSTDSKKETTNEQAENSMKQTETAGDQSFTDNENQELQQGGGINLGGDVGNNADVQEAFQRSTASEDKKSQTKEPDGISNLMSSAGKGADNNQNIENALHGMERGIQDGMRDNRNASVNMEQSNLDQKVEEQVAKDSTDRSGNLQDNVAKDNSNLLQYLSRNTVMGRNISDRYNQGKQFGHAAGNTMNQMNRKKENKTDHKDNLKG